MFFTWYSYFHINEVYQCMYCFNFDTASNWVKWNGEKKKKNNFLVVNKLNLGNMYKYAASFFTLDLSLGQVKLFVHGTASIYFSL